MKLTLEITDEQLSSLKDALKVDFIDYQKHWGREEKQKRVLLIEDYASRILWARKVLDLDCGCFSVCYNPPAVDPDIAAWQADLDPTYPRPVLDKSP